MSGKELTFGDRIAASILWGFILALVIFCLVGGFLYFIKVLFGG